MIDTERAKHLGDIAAVGVGGSAFSLAWLTEAASTATVWLTLLGALLSAIWVIWRMLDTRMAKALLFLCFGFDLEAWYKANRAGKDDG